MFNARYNIFISVVLLLSCQAHSRDVIYAAGERNAYYETLLSHALSYSPDKNYRVKRLGQPIPKQRSFNLLAKGNGVDVMNGSSTVKREEKYQAIYFPILKGLKGWRIALINKNTPMIFSDVKTQLQFRKITPGQFHSWTATKIFESNGIKVAKVATFKGLFQMLDKNRIDYLPRSVLEIQRDLTIYPELNLMIDPHVLIKYPTAYYFYVSKNNNELAKDIAFGLESALIDGSFDKIFNQAFGKQLSSLNLENRKTYNLDNPLLLDTTPINRKELWADNLIGSSLID